MMDRDDKRLDSHSCNFPLTGEIGRKVLHHFWTCLFAKESKQKVPKDVSIRKMAEKYGD